VGSAERHVIAVIMNGQERGGGGCGDGEKIVHERVKERKQQKVHAFKSYGAPFVASLKGMGGLRYRTKGITDRRVKRGKKKKKE